MEIRNLTTFIRVAELQSFSRAAEQLGYSQSAVTVQIRQLEQELGTLLFERIGRHVRLTEEGEALVERAVAVLRAVQEAENVGKVGRQGGGKLRIGTAESLLISVLPPVFVEFGRKCPDALLSTKTGPVEDLFEMVRQNEIDLLYFLDRKTDFPEWIKVSEHRERAIFVASAAHPLAGEKHMSVERLQKEPLVLTERGISYRYALEQALAADGIALEPFLETGNTDVITRLVRENRGVSFLPEFVVREDLDCGRLAALSVDCPQIEMFSQLVYHRNKLVTPQMELFIRLLEERISRGSGVDKTDFLAYSV